MKAKIARIIVETPNISSFFLRPTAQINYIPGQFVYLTLPKLRSDPKGRVRHFSLSSSPHEHNLLHLTVQNGISDYKKALFSMKEGDTVNIDGPLGVYHWDYNPSVSHIFIVGGVGIAPFRGRIIHNYINKVKSKLYLVYSTKNIGACAFYKELQDIAKSYQYLKIYNHFSNQVGRISTKTLQELELSTKNTYYWVCGLPQFVDDIEQMLDDIGIDSKMVNTEKFT